MRIDSKFHIEDNKIVKTSNGESIPQDEPLFLLRARDYLALPLLVEYRKLCINDRCTPYQLKKLDLMIAEFVTFATKNPTKMKQPGITRGL